MSRTFTDPRDIALADAAIELTLTAIELDELHAEAEAWRQLTYEALGQLTAAFRRIEAYREQMQRAMGIHDDELRQMRAQ